MVKFVILHPEKLIVMKRLLVILLVFSGFLGVASGQEHDRYALIWNDEFDGSILDSEVWSKIKRNRAEWAVHMSPHDTLYSFENGNLVLRGMVNDFLPTDKAQYLTGGVWSKYKKTFGFGRIEVRAKFDVAQGFWPAIWMLPETNHALNWPHGGEIDIMEHFRSELYVNQTIHSHYTYHLKKGSRPPHVSYPKYNVGEYNTYGVERFQDSLVFFVNGKRSFTYPRFRKGNDGQFPFSQHDYYLILDAQLGYDGSPSVDESKLPVEMRVDYVRYYELDTKTDVIPEPQEYQQLSNRRYKFKKMKVNAEETFANPDEYRIVVKRGKAKVSGNVVWAQSTLDQLVGGDGKVANLEVHDRAACPYRGVSLEKCSRKLTFNDLNQLLDWMAFHKLNYLQWNGEGSCSKEEANKLRDHARDLGITIVGGVSKVSNVDLVDLEGSAKNPASSQIFLRTASEKGGWLFLKGLEKADWDAMTAFAERYWRGGGAGEVGAENGQPVALSPAGSRLANFKERVAIHNTRFGHK